jgi:hypothetical protein
MRSALLARLALSVALSLAASACDDKTPPPKGSSASGTPQTDGTVSAAAPAATPAAPAAPTKPQLAVDDNAAFVAGERLEMAAPDPKGRIAGSLAGKPVEGETIVLNASRDAKLPKVLAVFAALASK